MSCFRLQLTVTVALCNDNVVCVQQNNRRCVRALCVCLFCFVYGCVYFVLCIVFVVAYVGLFLCVCACVCVYVFILFCWLCVWMGGILFCYADVFFLYFVCLCYFVSCVCFYYVVCVCVCVHWSYFYLFYVKFHFQRQNHVRTNTQVTAASLLATVKTIRLCLACVRDFAKSARQPVTENSAKRASFMNYVFLKLLK